MRASVPIRFLRASSSFFVLILLNEGIGYPHKPTNNGIYPREAAPGWVEARAAVPPSSSVAFSLIAMLVGQLPESARRKAKRARAVRPSHRAELNYLADLLVVVEACRRAGNDVAAGLAVHWDETVPASDERRAADAPPPPPGEPLPSAPALDVLIEQAARRFGNIDAVAERLAKLSARRTLGAVDETLTKNIMGAVGVDISSYLGTDTEIGASLADAAEANIELIKSIPKQYLDGVRDTVSKAFAAGERFESVAKRIAHIGDVTESRARLIARDQISKLTSKFNEVRQASVGITGYDWSTSHDERVRPSHRALDGTRQRWDRPPSVGHPGEDYLCRCVAIPVISLAEEPATGETEERQAA